MNEDESNANDRATGKARSKAGFIATLGPIEEEADETAGWIELLIKGEIMAEKRLKPLLTEARELRAIFAASRKAATRNEKLQIANRKSQMRRPSRSRRSASK